MDVRTQRNRLQESAKLQLRRRLGKWGLDIGRDPYVNRLVRTLDSRGIETVLDIGANVGQFGGLLRSAGFAGRIVSLEPLQSAFAVLSARSSGDPSWTVLNLGVGAKPADAVINVSANSYSSSMLPMHDNHLRAAPESRIIGSQATKLTTVMELVGDLHLDPHSCLLKVDTQGYESQVLEGAGHLLDLFPAIQLELSFVELYDGQALYDDLVTTVRERGLELWSLDPGISSETGRLLQVDGLFVRPIPDE